MRYTWHGNPAKFGASISNLTYVGGAATGKTVIPIRTLLATGIPFSCAGRKTHCESARTADCDLASAAGIGFKSRTMPASSITAAMNTGAKLVIGSALG